MSSPYNQIVFSTFRKQMQQQCITVCTDLTNSKINPLQQNCLKNCYGKLGNFAKLSKQLGFPIK